MNYVNSKMGNIGYNIYLKDSEGNLQLLDFITTNTYQINIDVSGEYTYVVKTAYSIFKDNMSDGKTVKINVTVDSPIIPNPDDTTTENPENPENPDNTENNKEESIN